MVDVSGGIGQLQPMIDAAGGLLMVAVLFFMALFMLAGVAAGVYFYLQRQKRFDEFEVSIYGKDSFGNPVLIKDKAGIFVNRKTGNKRLYLKNGKISLNADRIPYILDGKIGGKKHISIARLGVIS